MDEQIIKAIRGKRLIEFIYHGLQRIAEPHVFGYLNGIKQLLVYQIRGQSRSGGLPNWRRVDIHEMSQLGILDETFPGRRPHPSGKHSSWDSYIAVVE